MQKFGNLCAILLISLSLCFGHTYFSSLTIDGVVNKEGDCIRPHPSSKYDYPIAALDRPNGLSSADMTCGWLPSASKPANKKCPVNPGSKVVIQWHYEMGLGASDNFIIDPSHKGPCLVYMAKSETGSGPVWFKIFEDGYDTATKKFCVDKLRANKGQLEITIPSDIAPGNYLLRGELIALHEGFELNGAQPYVGCAEVTVGGSGTAVPGNLVSFPGAYSPNDPGIFFNVYSGSIKSYPIPGPKLYVAGSSSNTPSPTPTPTPSVTTGKANQGATTGSSRTSTTGKSSTTGQATNTGSNGGDTDEMMCYLPSTPNINGRINKNSGKCGKNDKSARCYEGQCCSKFGYCGSSSQYCNADSSADYRKVKCSSVGLKFSNAFEEKIEIVDDDPNVEASYGIKNTMVAGLTIAAMFAAFA